MPKPLRRATTGLLAALALALPSTAEEACQEDAMIVFDGSGSMAEMGFNDLDEPRIFSARRALRRVIPEIAAIRRLGLMIYGPGGADGCSGLDLRFRPVAGAGPLILAEIDGLQPAGDTPLTVAVSQAARVLEETSGGGTVVVVTDGKETCGGAPCQLAADMAGRGVTLHVIGFKVRGEHFAWSDQTTGDASETVSRCLADRTGGLYVSAETVEDLIGAFRKTLGCTIVF